MNDQLAKVNGFRRAEHWEKSCEYCNCIEDGNHYCLCIGTPITNADIMICDNFEEHPDGRF